MPFIAVPVPGEPTVKGRLKSRLISTMYVRDTVSGNGLREKTYQTWFVVEWFSRKPSEALGPGTCGT